LFQLTQHWPLQAGVSVDPKRIEELREKLNTETEFWLKEYVRQCTVCGEGVVQSQLIHQKGYMFFLPNIYVLHVSCISNKTLTAKVCFRF